MKHKFIALMISTFMSASSQSDIISKSIPSLIGQYEYGNGGKTVPFDIGVRFLSIESVSIVVTAQGIDGLAQVCNTIITGPNTSTYSCNNYRESPKLFYRFSTENITETGALVVDSTGWNTTSNVLNKTDLLLDGKGALHIGHVRLDFHNYFQTYPILFVSDVSVVIDGVKEQAIDPIPQFLPVIIPYILF